MYNNQNNQTPEVKIWPYAIPMVLNIAIFILLQLFISFTCSALPNESRGECGAGWLNLFFIYPLELIVFIICFLILGVGLNKRGRRNKEAYARENRVAYYGLAIFLLILGGLFWYVDGRPTTPFVYVPIGLAFLIYAVFYIKDRS